MLKQSFILLICLYISTHAFGQSYKQTISLDAKVGVGAILPHYEFMNFIIDENIKNIECNLQFHSFGETKYEALYNYPSTGIGIQYTTLGNKEKLGNALTAFGIFNMPLVYKNDFEVDFQVGFGLAYLNNSLRVNPYNTLLSSPISFYASFDLYGIYNFKNHNAIKLGLELSHLSNGKTSTPNLGLNSYALTLAYSYALQHRDDENLIVPIKFDKHYQVSMFCAGGRKTDDFLTDKLFKTNSIRMDFEYIPSVRLGYSIGADYFYDESIRIGDSKEEIKDRSRYGVHIGAGLHYNKLSLQLQYGKYIGELINNHKYYMRTAVVYQVYKKLNLQIAVKTHGATADFLELGIGYTIFSKSYQSILL